MRMSRLEGQAALVTGGGRGLGRSVALRLAAEGAAVVIDDMYIDDEGSAAAERVAEEIRSNGGRATAMRENVSTTEGGDAMVAAAVEQYGRLDILVTCAGNFVRGPIQDLTDEQWDSLVAVHLRGHFVCARAATRQMLEQDYGRIITVASRGAYYDLPRSKSDPASGHKPSSTAYSAVKAGIMGFTNTLALELWETGITANCLLPSATTQLFPGTAPRMVGGVPPSSSLDPDYIAPVVAFLASPEAEAISGKVVYASGGDVILFGSPLDMAGARMVRTSGMWTLDELQAVLPTLTGAV
jgi:3-oxoacyl-[acyl-carrier protein] reductase